MKDKAMAGILHEKLELDVLSLIDVLTYTMHAAATLFAHSITYLPPLPPRRTSFELTLPNGVDLNAETLF